MNDNSCKAIVEYNPFDSLSTYAQYCIIKKEYDYLMEFISKSPSWFSPINTKDSESSFYVEDFAGNISEWGCDEKE